MGAITNALRTVLDGIYAILGNYGWSIVIFTILIKAVLLPFDFKSRKGMRKMQRIQPEINALQKKYANDKQKLQQKQAELMKREKYNPMAGCLPMLLTLPVLYAMFGAMRVIANEQTVRHVFEYLSGSKPTFDSWLWVRNIWMPDSPFATMVPDINSLRMIGFDVWQRVFETLKPEQVELILQNIGTQVADFDGALSFVSADALNASLPNILTTLNAMPEYVSMLQPIPGWANLSFVLFTVTLYQNFNGFLILPALAGATQVMATKLNPAADPSAASNAASGNKGGSANFMKYFFPMFSVFICLTSNAGFALYWVVTNIVASASSVMITRYYDAKDAKELANKGDVSV
ncbi:MAG: YidC/Oxa1 family membrane protein insertase [Christensenellales bacterium]